VRDRQSRDASVTAGGARHSVRDAPRGSVLAQVGRAVSARRAVWLAHEIESISRSRLAEDRHRPPYLLDHGLSADT